MQAVLAYTDKPETNPYQQRLAPSSHLLFPAVKQHSKPRLPAVGMTQNPGPARAGNLRPTPINLDQAPTAGNTAPAELAGCSVTGYG